MALAREGVDLLIVARRREVLESAAEEIAAGRAIVRSTIAADVTTREGRDAILAACPDPDILINDAGGPPPGDFRNFEREDWIKALDGNMLAPIALIKAPVAMLALSNGARTCRPHRLCRRSRPLDRGTM